MDSILKGLKWAIFSIAIFFILALTVLYLPFLYYRTQALDSEKAARFVSTDSRWGDLADTVFFLLDHKDKSSRFLRFPEKKPPGVIRIGTFGDSYTWGDEVGPDDDFPRYLKEIFHKHHLEGVEVLNFGNSWTGFFQNYLVWEQFANKYEIDVAVFGPGMFFAERDLMLNHTNDVFPDYIHSRFIWADGKAVQIDPLGQTSLEKIALYYRFIPPWAYLKYDHRSPAFLRPFLELRGQRKNPFYYTSMSVEEELDNIMADLVSRIRAHQPHLLFSSFSFMNFEERHPKTTDLSKNISMPRIEEFPFYLDGHYSPLGNYMLAKVYFASLTGESTFEVMDVSYRPRSFIPNSPPPHSKHPVTKIRLALDSDEIGQTIPLGRDRREVSFLDFQHGLLIATQNPVRFFLMQSTDLSFLEKTRCLKEVPSQAPLRILISDCSFLIPYGKVEVGVGEHCWKTSCDLDLAQYGTISEIRALLPPKNFEKFLRRGHYTLTLRVYRGDQYDEYELGDLAFTPMVHIFPSGSRSVIEKLDQGTLNLVRLSSQLDSNGPPQPGN